SDSTPASGSASRKTPATTPISPTKPFHSRCGCRASRKANHSCSAPPTRKTTPTSEATASEAANGLASARMPPRTKNAPSRISMVEVFMPFPPLSGGFRHHFPHIRQMPGDRRRRGHAGADQMGAAAAALTALEIAVRGRRTALAGGQLVRVHRKAHRAAGQTPFETGVDEDLRQPLLLRLRADKARSRHHHRPHPRGDL